uniref:Uncharacterized protein n=1 Tax=Manihot esculenta TaxID=3983 RepID=A0A2C9V7B4_MANES
MARLKSLNAIFCYSLKAKAAATATVKNSPAMDAALKHDMSSLDISSPSISHSIGNSSLKYPNSPTDPIHAPASLADRTVLPILNAEDSGLDSEEATKQPAKVILSILSGIFEPLDLVVACCVLWH